MLEQMSRVKVAMGWEFVLPYDIEFVQKHPDVYKQQLTMWEAKYQVLQKQLNFPKQDKLGMDLKRITSDSCSSAGSKRVSKPSNSKSNHVMNHNTLHEGSSEEQHLPMEIDCKEVASNNMNPQLPKEPLSTNDTHVRDTLKILQDFVHEKLHRTVLSLADFKRLLLLRQTASSPGDPLCSGVPDTLLEKAILSTGATEIDFKWPTEALSGDIQSRRLFSFRSTGDTADEYRALLLDMFSKSWVLTRREFNARATEQVGTVPGRKVWMTIQQVTECEECVCNLKS
ncbi:DNA-directed RNA polymerase III subunit RPC5-like [Stylophora pistillata]|uniref:DNA-directed RNA polymerase III subunit RPC5-like n=1 Tax=Stylophora pistillata TaxID=50429 RepID=UPI000C04ADD5|nr:DNA-directed RNA polymerase III subunit RPC5-like [Stylophora pistillata]